MKRVLQVCQPEDGGVARHVLELSRGLVRRGWIVEAAVSPASTIRTQLADAGVVVHELPLKREPGAADLRAARALRALDRKRCYAIVHGHSSKAGALVRGILPGRRRLVYTPHGFIFAADLGTGRKLAYTAVEQGLVARSAAIVAVCAFERGLAARRLRGTGSRIHVIYNGVPECPVGEPSRELLNFRGQEPLAGWVGVLRPEKEPLLAVRAAASLVREGRLPGRLAIVGNGGLRDEVRDEITRLGVGERVRWFPFHGQMAPYLKTLDLLVLSSAWEAFPLAVLEAMSCGVPVLATSVGGVPEAVEDGVTGRLVAPRDARALGAALGEMLGAPDLGPLGEAGRAKFERRFRVAAMVDAVAELYADLLAVT